MKKFVIITLLTGLAFSIQAKEALPQECVHAIELSKKWEAKKGIPAKQTEMSYQSFTNELQKKLKTEEGKFDAIQQCQGMIELVEYLQSQQK